MDLKQKKTEYEAAEPEKMLQAKLLNPLLCLKELCEAISFYWAWKPGEICQSGFKAPPKPLKHHKIASKKHKEFTDIHQNSHRIRSY